MGRVITVNYECTRGRLCEAKNTCGLWGVRGGTKRDSDKLSWEERKVGCFGDLLWCRLLGQEFEPSFVKLFVGAFPVAAVAVFQGSSHAFVGDGVVAVVEDCEETTEPVGQSTDPGEQIGETGEQKVLRKTRVERPDRKSVV